MVEKGPKSFHMPVTHELRGVVVVEGEEEKHEGRRKGFPALASYASALYCWVWRTQRTARCVFFFCILFLRLFLRKNSTMEADINVPRRRHRTDNAIHSY